jgi:hypothetical protein
VPVRRGPKYFRIRLDNEQGGDEDEIVATAGTVFHSEEEVPTITNSEKRTQKETSPWRISRAKMFFQEHLLDEDDSIHNKTEDQIFHTSMYDNGELVVKTKYPIASFKANFKRLKTKVAHNKAAALHGETALDLEKKLYPRPALNFHGDPYYAGSTIRSNLMGDIKTGAASAAKKPLEIMATREEYYHYQGDSKKKKTFRNHLYRERRKEIEKVGWQLRRNKEGYEQHEKEHREAREK